MLEIPGCSCLGFTSQSCPLRLVCGFPLNELYRPNGASMSEVTLERLKQLPYRRHYPMTLTKELRSKGVWRGMVEGFVTIWDMECGGMSSLLGHLLLRNPQISFLQRDHRSRSIKIISALQLLPTHTTWLVIFLNILRLKSMWFGLIWYLFLCKPLVIRIPRSSPGQRSAQEEQASGKTWTEEEGFRVGDLDQTNLPWWYH